MGEGRAFVFFVLGGEAHVVASFGFDCSYNEIDEFGSTISYDDYNLECGT